MGYHVEMKQLIYIADPMCSWCWGFAPQLAKLQSHFGGRLSIIPIMGGLRPGHRDPMTEELKTAVRSHWIHVAEATGQRFDYGFFDRHGYIYDTEPACRAVVAVRTIQPEVSLMYFGAVQQAFYVEGRDVTQTSELVDCATSIGLDANDFTEAYDSPGAEEAVERDFMIRHRMKVKGFPALFAEEIGHKPVMLIEGYRKLDGLIPAIEKWLG